MCVAAAAVPAWVAYASMAASAIGAGVSAFSAIQQGQQAQSMANMQAAEADRQARERITQGREQEQDHRMRVAQMVGEQVAGFAASGVDTASGSPLSVIGDTAALGEVDALRIRSNTYADAGSLRRQADLYRAEGAAARQSGYLNAAGSLLGGAASVGSMYYGMTQSGGYSSGPSGRVSLGLPKGPTRSVSLRGR